MAELSDEADVTALLVIDPYNDFVSEGGKAWARVKTTAQPNGCIAHMEQVMAAARAAGLRVFYALHHRYRPGDYETWDYMAPVQERAWRARSFEYGTWGGEIREEFKPRDGDVVALEHWGSSGFANTDLDQQLKLHGIRHLIVIGLLTNTCVEATVRYAAELGYKPTVVKDATASLAPEEMHASLDVNLPNYALITSTSEIVNALASLGRARSASSVSLAMGNSRPGGADEHPTDPTEQREESRVAPGGPAAA
jgi:ureidoacrylate peracid hydrolase